jgi:hypothetical protein
LGHKTSLDSFKISASFPSANGKKFINFGVFHFRRLVGPHSTHAWQNTLGHRQLADAVSFSSALSSFFSSASWIVTSRPVWLSSEFSCKLKLLFLFCHHRIGLSRLASSTKELTNIEIISERRGFFDVRCTKKFSFFQNSSKFWPLMNL